LRYLITCASLGRSLGRLGRADTGSGSGTSVRTLTRARARAGLRIRTGTGSGSGRFGGRFDRRGNGGPSSSRRPSRLGFQSKYDRSRFVQTFGRGRGLVGSVPRFVHSSVGLLVMSLLSLVLVLVLSIVSLSLYLRLGLLEGPAIRGQVFDTSDGPLEGGSVVVRGWGGGSSGGSVLVEDGHDDGVLGWAGKLCIGQRWVHITSWRAGGGTSTRGRRRRRLM